MHSFLFNISVDVTLSRIKIEGRKEEKYSTIIQYNSGIDVFLLKLKSYCCTDIILVQCLHIGLCTNRIRIFQFLSIFLMNISSKIRPLRKIAFGLRVRCIPQLYIPQCQQPASICKGHFILAGSLCTPSLRNLPL